jgi:hypothetical protein
MRVVQVAQGHLLIEGITDERVVASNVDERILCNGTPNIRSAHQHVLLEYQTRNVPLPTRVVRRAPR